MSLCIYPVFNPPVPDAAFEELGEVLACDIEAIEQVAEEHGITGLMMAFGDTREIPEDFDGSPDELDDVLGPWDDWFCCRDGITAMEALADLIERNPAAAQSLESPESVAGELRSIARVLGLAHAEGAQFRLEMA